MTKKAIKVLGIALAAVVLIIGIVFFSLLFFQKKPLVASPGYLTGFVSKDRSVLILGSDYRLFCMPDTKVSDGLTLIAMHSPMGLSHLIVPSGSENVVSNLNAILEYGLAIESVYAPISASESEAFTLFTQAHPEIMVTYLKAFNRYGSIGDLLLTKKDYFSDSFTYTLTHGEEKYLFSEETVKGGKYSLIVMPVAPTVKSTCKGEYAFLVNRTSEEGPAATAEDSMRNNSLADKLFVDQSGEFFSTGSEPLEGETETGTFFALQYEEVTP